jgi:hypothetical protein
MMRFKNVPEPAGFQEAVHENKESILADFEKNRTVDFKGRETWTRFKSDMASATFGKCGYCEVNVTAVDRFKGDVEHYRPKGRVDRLVVEPDGTVKVEPLFGSGYHWLAYSWSNYILTCNPCNSAHKRNFFPLKAEPLPAPEAGDVATEDALLAEPARAQGPQRASGVRPPGRRRSPQRKSLRRSHHCSMRPIEEPAREETPPDRRAGAATPRRFRKPQRICRRHRPRASDHRRPRHDGQRTLRNGARHVHRNNRATVVIRRGASATSRPRVLTQTRRYEPMTIPPVTSFRGFFRCQRLQCWEVGDRPDETLHQEGSIRACGVLPVLDRTAQLSSNGLIGTAGGVTARVGAWSRGGERSGRAAVDFVMRRRSAGFCHHFRARCSVDKGNDNPPALPGWQLDGRGQTSPMVAQRQEARRPPCRRRPASLLGCSG